MIDVEGLSALLIQIAQQPLLVEMKNVLIPVIVHEMLIAHPVITGVYAIVALALQEILMGSLAHLVRNI